jgi:pilus assembly protein CpaF
MGLLKNLKDGIFGAENEEGKIGDSGKGAHANPPQEAAAGNGLLSRIEEEGDHAPSFPSVLREVTNLERIKERVHSRLIDDMPSAIMTEMNMNKKQKMLRDRIMTVITQESPRFNMTLTPAEMDSLILILLSDMIGFGPLQSLLDDDEITEIFVNGPFQVFVEKKGKRILSEAKFKDNDHVMRMIERIVAPLGRQVNESSPCVEARLPDGSFVSVVIPPFALNGPCMNIRKFKKERLQLADMVKLGLLSSEIASFLEGCIKSRLNVFVSGGLGSGKTEMLGVLCDLIPEDERIILYEDPAELRLAQSHVLRFERPPAIPGKPAVTMSEVIRSTLRMRPDRIILGECRGSEALDLLQAINAGHDGLLTTICASAPQDMLDRLEIMAQMAGLDLPVRAIRGQIASSIHLIIQQSRFKDGSRRITHITEVQGMENDRILTQDIFRFERTGTDETGRIAGRMIPTGTKPKIPWKFEESGHCCPV